MTHAAERGWCERLIIRRPKVETRPPVWITLAEANRLIDACADHLRPLVIFLIYTGARIGEALWLDWRNVDLASGRVSFPKTKNSESRGVPLHPRVVAALANIKHRDSEVFRRPDGLPYERPAEGDDDDTSAGTRIKTAFGGARRRAGIKRRFGPHGCRHTWATWHYAANRDIGALQRLGGWKSIAMVMRYTHVNVDELKGTIDRLPEGNVGNGELQESKSA
jgi:integrase